MSIRDRILNANKPRFEDVTDPATGATFRVYQPNLRQRHEILKAVKAEDESIESFLMAICTTVVVDPDTGKPVLEKTDRDVVAAQTESGWIKLVAATFNKLVSDAEVKAEGKGG